MTLTEQGLFVKNLNDSWGLWDPGPKCGGILSSYLL